ncbi:hypothetical protein C8J56DRAFT_1166905 [Mycena floridula]|nr:hypothetical protein C8J56DRAFT_1166905 [Mycena floridula]
MGNPRRSSTASTSTSASNNQAQQAGSLTTSQGLQYIPLTEAQRLQQRIQQLAARIQQLEDALARSHSMNTTQTHPLLVQELLQMKNVFNSLVIQSGGQPPSSS